MIILNLLILITVLAGICVSIFIHNKRQRWNDYMPFGNTLYKTKLPIVTFTQGDNELNFILDSGANYSIIDSNALKPLEYEKIKSTTNLTSISGNTESVSMVDMKFNYKEMQFSDKFQIIDTVKSFNKIENMYNIKVHGLLGNNFMCKYKYVLDFDAMIAYTYKK